MNTKILWFLLLLFCQAAVFSCGEKPGPEPLYLTGTVGGKAVLDHLDKPVVVIAVKGERMMDLYPIDTSMSSDLMDDVVSFIPINKETLSFQMDLSEADVRVGDELALIVLVDVNDSSDFPFPNKGDFIGIYVDEEALTYTYKLKNGLNDGIHIDATREIFDFSAAVEGTITGEDMGSMMIVAYSGEITSLDMSTAINFDDIIGFKEIEKTKKIQNFTIDIFPYGKNIPIQDVYIMAILDKNSNGKPDGGDMIGYLPDEENMPAGITVDEGVTVLGDKDISLTMALSDASGYDVPLKGTIELPEGEFFHKDSPPLYVILVSPDSLSSISSFSSFSSDLLGIVKYFTKITSTLPADQGTHFVDFELDLSNSPLKAGDEVMVAAFWDKDFKAGFLKPTENDRFGFYNNKEDLTFSITLKNPEDFSKDDTEFANIVPGLDGDEFKLNKVWYEHHASVQYRLEAGALEGHYDIGDQMIVIAFQRNGMKFKGEDLFPLNKIMNIGDIVSADIDYLVGFQMFEIDETTFDPDHYFNLELLPFQLEGLVNGPGFNNIDDVGIFAVHGLEWSDFSIEAIRYFGYYYQQNRPNIFLNLSNIKEYLPEFMEDRGVRFMRVPHRK